MNSWPARGSTGTSTIAMAECKHVTLYRISPWKNRFVRFFSLSAKHISFHGKDHVMNYFSITLSLRVLLVILAISLLTAFFLGHAHVGGIPPFVQSTNLFSLMTPQTTS